MTAKKTTQKRAARPAKKSPKKTASPKKVEQEAPKKPSGSAYRKAARQRRQAESARQAASPRRRITLPPPEPPQFAHLEAVQILQRQMRQVASDTGILPTERWRYTNDTIRALGMLQVKADWERQVKEMREEVLRAQDELEEARTAVQTERRALADLRARLEQRARELGVSLDEPALASAEPAPSPPEEPPPTSAAAPPSTPPPSDTADTPPHP